MPVLVYTNSFLKSAKELPKPEQNKLAKLLEILRVNPFHNKLHTKSLLDP